MGTVEQASYSTLTTRRDLRLASLFTEDLWRLNCQRSDLIDTPATHYGRTRRWAAAIHASSPVLDGIIWASAKYDRTEAMILFGDRLQHDALVKASSDEIASSKWLANLEELADRSGIVLT